MIIRDTEEFIGECGFLPQKVGGKEEIEIGYHVHRNHWRKGYATEAALACREFAFMVMKPKKLISLVRPENTPSAGVAKKLGMSVEIETQHGGFLHHVYSVQNPKS